MTPEAAIKDVRVRVIGAPERTGSIVSSEPRDINGVLHVRVLFDDGTRRMLRVEHLEPLPETLVEIVGNEHKSDPLLTTAYDEASKRFAERAIYSGIRCVNSFRASLRNVHVRADFDPWPEHVRFFFTGGGSRSPFFRKLFVEGDFERELLPYTRWEIDDERRRRMRQGLKLERLPLPPELKGMNQNMESDFDRLSVAHGLAYGSENLMRITGSVNS